MKILTLVILTLLSSNLFSQSTEDGVVEKILQKKERFAIYGDYRFRTELDRNSIQYDSTYRNDRDRFRYRFRLGLTYQNNDYYEVGFRICSGAFDNQQSPHVTLGNGFKSDQFGVDKAYIKFKTKKNIWAWIGKNTIPYWEQNELLWDKDVNMEGLAIGGKKKTKKRIIINPLVGYFIVNNNNLTFGLKDHTIILSQLKFSKENNKSKIIFSSGIINGNRLPNTSDQHASYLIDFVISTSSFQYHFQKPSIVLGADYFHNFSNYQSHPFVDNAMKDQKTGFVFHVRYLKNKYCFAAYYSYIQKYAVIDYFAQDDWVRWGNSNMTRSSNFKGFELRGKYEFTDKMNLVLRFYNVEGIAKPTGAKCLETGTRIRLDFNVTF